MESAEREFFGPKSFFKRFDEGHLSPLSDDDPDPAEPGSGLVGSGRQGEENGVLRRGLRMLNLESRE